MDVEGPVLKPPSMQPSLCFLSAPHFFRCVSAIVNEAKTSTGLVEGLNRELHQGVKERLENDPDFNSQQFPAADRVYQPGK